MNLRQTFAMWIALVPCAALLSCGTATPRMLQSISISPATVAASGQTAVQFTATDHWNTSPAQTPPVGPMWGLCHNNEPPTDATITQAGLVTCGKGASGTYNVFVEDPKGYTGPVCNVINACGEGCQPAGSAQLTCP